MRTFEPEIIVRRNNRLWLSVMFCGFLFEAVFVVPLDSIRDGVRLQFMHLSLAAVAGLFFFQCVWKKSVPKLPAVFIGLLLIYSYGLAVSFIVSGSVYAVFLYLQFLFAFIFYIAILKQLVDSNPNALLAPLNALSVLWTLALVEWGISMFGIHLPEVIDRREHQEFAGIPRFEGFSPLSLGAAYWLVIYFFMALAKKKWLSVCFAVLLIGLTLSSGVFIAFAICLMTYCLIAARGIPAKMLILAGGITAGIAIAALVSDTKTDSWSAAERLSFYFYLPEFLAGHPFGIGIGGTRVLTDQFDVPMVLGGFVDHDNSESSLLDLAYELGFIGIAFYVFLLGLTVRLLPFAVAAGGAPMMIVFVNFFVLVHSFFNPAYFSQPRYLIALMMLLSVSQLRSLRQSEVRIERRQGPPVARPITPAMDS